MVYNDVVEGSVIMQRKLFLSKTSKVIIGIAFGIYGLFLLLLYDQKILGLFSILQFTRSTPAPTALASPSSVTSPSPTPEGVFSESLFTPQGDYFVTLSSTLQEDQKYLIKLSGSGWGERNHMDPNGIQKSLWQVNVDNSTVKTYKYELEHSLLWSSVGYKLALLTHNNSVEVWQFKEEIVDYKSFTGRTLKLKTHDSYQLDGDGYSLLFFENNQIYLENARELYTLLPTLKKITGISHIYGYQDNGVRLSPTLFALPTGDGIGFGGQREISFWRNGRIITYPLDADDLGVDGYFKAIVSPGLDKLCVVSQSSGYIGYSVFRLEGGRFHLVGERGMQYSDCEKWLDDDHVIVGENAYPSQYFYQHFSLDVRTGKKTLLSRYGRSEP